MADLLSLVRFSMKNGYTFLPGRALIGATCSFAFMILLCCRFYGSDAGSHLLLAAVVSSYIAIFIELARWIAASHAHAVREIVHLFSFSFSVVLLLFLYLHHEGYIGHDGAPVGRLAGAFMRVVQMEMDLRDDIAFSLGVFSLLVVSSCVGKLLQVLLRVDDEDEGSVRRHHLGFGLYLLERTDARTGARAAGMSVSIQPVKLLAVMMVKCFCAAGASFCAVCLILFGFFPAMGHGLTVRLEVAFYCGVELGVATVFAVAINEKTGPFIERLRSFRKTRWMRRLPGNRNVAS